MQLNMFDEQAPEPKKPALTQIRRRWATKDEREYYKAIKAHVGHNLTHVPWCAQVDCPVEWAKTFLPLITDCAHEGDYVGAQATKDAIIEFLNSFGTELPTDVLLTLPEYEELDIRGIVCLGVEGDRSGMASGGAVFL